MSNAKSRRNARSLVEKIQERAFALTLCTDERTNFDRTSNLTEGSHCTRNAHERGVSVVGTEKMQRLVHDIWRGRLDE
jgi:hypothetical protein